MNYSSPTIGVRFKVYLRFEGRILTVPEVYFRFKGLLIR